MQAFNRLCLYFGSLFAIGLQAMNIATRTKVRAFPAHVEAGASLVEGPYQAETFPVKVEADYVVVEV